MDWLRTTLSSPFGGFLAGPARTDSVGGEGLQGMGATTVSTFVPGVEGQDPASFAGTPGVNERVLPNDAEQGGDGLA